MKYYIIFLLLLLVFVSDIQWARAQSPGSVETNTGLNILSGGTTATASETVYLGPGTYQIDGTWEIYSRFVWISPDAVITGSGFIRFFNPFVAGGIVCATVMDGNNSSSLINVNLQLDNNSGMALSQLTADPDLVTAGWTDNTAASTLNVGMDLNLATDGAYVWLGTGTVGDLVFGPSATISNYGVNRMVVTNNSVLSHVTKQNSAIIFTYPIGITEGDYTPATVTPSSTQTIHVSVQDYANSASTEAVTAEGMNRTWHIYGNAAGTATVTLQHNSPATDGGSYVNNMGFITQYQGSGWSSSPSPDFVSAGIHTHSGMAIAGSSVANDSYFSKASDALTPLPVKLISFTAGSSGCDAVLEWVSAGEVQFSKYEVEYSRDGILYTTIGTVAGTNNVIGGHYAFRHRMPADFGYYRLKMIDINKHFEYSAIVLARRNCSSPSIVLMPNPTKQTAYVRGLSGGEIIQLYNASGQLLMQKRATDWEERLDVSDYASGVYTVIVYNGSQRVLNVKVMKQ